MPDHDDATSRQSGQAATLRHMQRRHARDLPLRRMLAYFVPRMRAAMPRMRKRLLPRLSRHAQVRDPMVDLLDADAPDALALCL